MPITTPDERWRPVSGYAGLYEVSSRGRVRSLPRVVPVPGQHCLRRVRGRILSPSVRPSDGRQHFTLCRSGVKCTRGLDRLLREVGFKS
jgi:NUMOD4 motif